MNQKPLNLTIAFQDVSRDMTDAQVGDLCRGLIRSHFLGLPLASQDPAVRKAFKQLFPEGACVGDDDGKN